jgi:hypothetical protein
MLGLIVVQIATGGGGVFSLAADDTEGAQILGFHFLGPLVILVLILIMIAAGFVGRLPWQMTGLAAAFFPLLVLQAIFISPFVNPSRGMTWLAGLHVVNAVFIFWLAFQWIEWTRRDLDRIRQSEAVGT